MGLSLSEINRGPLLKRFGSEVKSSKKLPKSIFSYVWKNSSSSCQCQPASSQAHSVGSFFYFRAAYPHFVLVLDERSRDSRQCLSVFGIRPLLVSSLPAPLHGNNTQISKSALFLSGQQGFR